MKQSKVVLAQAVATVFVFDEHWRSLAHLKVAVRKLCAFWDETCENEGVRQRRTTESFGQEVCTLLFGRGVRDLSVTGAINLRRHSNAQALMFR